MFAKFNDVSELDKVFTSMMKTIKTFVEDDFATYQDEFGLKTNEFSDFAAFNLEDIMVEYDNGELGLYYKFTDENICKIINFFINRDLIALNKKCTKCSVARSNNKKLANYINKILSI